MSLINVIWNIKWKILQLENLYIKIIILTSILVVI